MGILVERKHAAILGDRLRQEKTRIVFTNGCFDIIHPGHIYLLNEARRHGHVLVVGLNSDRSVRLNKGKGRPFIQQYGRAAILCSMAMVDYVIIFDQKTPAKLIAALKPHVLIKGGDWKHDEIVGRSLVDTVVRISTVRGWSTTELGKRLAALS